METLVNDLFNKMKLELEKHTKQIIEQFDEKLEPLSIEIKELKLENQELKEQIRHMEKDKRANNIILFGLKENEKSSTELIETAKQKIITDLNISLENRDINKIYRLGRKSSKDRPVLVSFTNYWKKREITRNKNKLKEVYIAEDYPKEILEKRKELKEKLIEERNKGNFAIINYDKLIVKEGMARKDNRKRFISSLSPSEVEQPCKQYAAAKSKRINAFDIMRTRSNSFPSTSSSKESSK